MRIPNIIVLDLSLQQTRLTAFRKAFLRWPVQLPFVALTLVYFLVPGFEYWWIKTVVFTPGPVIGCVLLPEIMIRACLKRQSLQSTTTPEVT